MEAIRYNIVEKVLGVQLRNPAYPGYFLGGYKTNFSSWCAEHALIYRPSIEALGKTPLVRINSACFTGDIFGDDRCDCNEQLKLALESIRNRPGLIIYHFHHEGRGLGFTSKLLTYQIMDRGKSTFEATSAVVNRDDMRTYNSAVRILQDLNIKRVRLISNNPLKRNVLEENGIEVIETVPSIVRRPALASYLRSKATLQRHAIEFDQPIVKENEK